MSSSLTEAELDEELAIEAKRALAYLQVNRNYRYVEFLAQGGYGWVSLVYDDDKQRSLAIKCTNDTSEMEMSWWPKLNHPNILPLLEAVTLDSCTVFIMPAMRKDVWAVINEPRFYEEELSFGLCRIWLRDVATALDYLHSQFLCHLDLKLDNVFLKVDGYACLGDFSLLSDIREVPSGFHFLEIYEPPEYTHWCHGAPPEAIASATKFGGDKADMWQYGILALDLLTNLKLTDSKSSEFTLFHHDIWPLLEKILLHEDYLNYLLEGTFLNVVFKKSDFNLCHEFLKNLLMLEPDNRISADEAKRHSFVDIEWPQLPKEFTLPKIIIEHHSESLPMPSEGLTPEQAKAAAAAVEEKDSDGAFDVMKRKMKKMQKEKIVRRESILEGSRESVFEPGKSPLESEPLPDKKGKKGKKGTKEKAGAKEEPSSDEKEKSDDKGKGKGKKGIKKKVQVVSVKQGGKFDVGKPQDKAKKKKGKS